MVTRLVAPLAVSLVVCIGCSSSGSVCIKQTRVYPYSFTECLSSPLGGLTATIDADEGRVCPPWCPDSLQASYIDRVVSIPEHFHPRRGAVARFHPAYLRLLQVPFHLVAPPSENSSTVISLHRYSKKPFVSRILFQGFEEMEPALCTYIRISIYFSELPKRLDSVRAFCISGNKKKYLVEERGKGG